MKPPTEGRVGGEKMSAQETLGARVAADQVYLDEFVFRHNRRRLPMASFQTLLGLGTGRKPTHYKNIRGAGGVSKSGHNALGTAETTG